MFPYEDSYEHPRSSSYGDDGELLGRDWDTPLNKAYHPDGPLPESELSMFVIWAGLKVSLCVKIRPILMKERLVTTRSGRSNG